MESLGFLRLHSSFDPLPLYASEGNAFNEDFLTEKEDHDDWQHK
jgi:hypothetical protein